MNKQQAESAAKLMKALGIPVEVRKCEEDCSEDKEPKGLEDIAKEFTDLIGKIKEAKTKAQASEAAESNSQSNSETKSGPTYANHAFQGLEDLASRVNLFVEHPMMVNLSTVEVIAVMKSVDQMLDTFEEHNEKFMEASSEDSRVRVYLNAIFYAVDLIMKTKADAGLLNKPDGAVKVNSAE